MRVLILLFLLTLGCTTPELTSTRTITDDLGRSIALPDSVTRILTLAPNLTELVYAIGAGNRMVGASQADDFPAEVTALPSFSTFPMDYEQIAALQPDLVLATDQLNTTRDADVLAEVGIATAFLSFETLADVSEATRQLGDWLHMADEATDFADAFDAHLAAAAQRTANVDERPSVIVLIGEQPLYSFGAGSYVQTLIELAGGTSLTAELPTANPILDAEFVLTQAPEVILMSTPPPYDPAKLLEAHPTWDIVPAIQNRRVYAIHPDLLTRPGPRLLDALDQLTVLLHPDLP
ncbi:MAG: helical backbone metal receptor [Rhodothermales bacterium]